MKESWRKKVDTLALALELKYNLM